jgi:hypothetical protein
METQAVQLDCLMTVSLLAAVLAAGELTLELGRAE